ncbi:hypothetical protein BU26DRAFT_279643 [Trematosphaeria pertusa]|uniref:F-box domain-containing protein n=1 Tax=Trematosphaeria pertusa TaxID=390896 RepID=A0A6A6IKY4_9PLEO|nr:uncharacterized protein BU26DRAFT_279643 [Trematosphaeria pertusa]KAF2251274.1 hypothetical protein BU26DRAFT_279643 [Trematosphaeria pertusa]
MGLLDLPTELLDGILDLTLPSGIESFALTCKTAYALAAPQVQRHNALKRQWRRTTNYSTPRHGDTLRILYEISRDPLVAEYIESLDLWNEEEPGPDEEEDAGREGGLLDDFRTDQAAMEKLKEMVTASEFLDGDGQEWWEQIVKEEEAYDGDNQHLSHATIALLGLLPNLKTLRLWPDWLEISRSSPKHDKWLRTMNEGLKRIVNRAGQGSGRPLGKLQAIVPYMWAGYEERTGLQDVQAFMTLPSLTELYLVSCIAVDDGYSGIPFEWAAPGLMSHLTRIELASCCMDADGLSALVSHTPKLSIFRYSHETKWHGCEHDWNPGSFIEALARNCGNTITELAITIDTLYGEIINGASSFLFFPKLEILEVDVRIFCGPPVESGQQLGENAVMPEGARPWTKEDIPCIGSMMPKSIVQLSINTEFPEPDEMALKSLLKNLKEQRAERLHKLETVILRQYSNDSAHEFAINAGATLEAFDHGVENVRPRHTMPLWKREFAERTAWLRS